jgi:hypothetical protein
MQLDVATRVTIAAGAALLAVALIAFGPAPAVAPHRPHARQPLARWRRPLRRRSRRSASGSLMYYLAASMAALLGGIVALAG